MSEGFLAYCTGSSEIVLGICSLVSASTSSNMDGVVDAAGGASEVRLALSYRWTFGGRLFMSGRIGWGMMNDLTR